jgi:hypothetical protein
MIFARELLSVILTPFILWYSLPPCALAIVDFFREFTIHVDGLGYVTSFAVFDFKRHGDIRVRDNDYTFSMRGLEFIVTYSSERQFKQLTSVSSQIKERWRNPS